MDQQSSGFERARPKVVLVLRILLALVFLGAGGAKLLGVQAMVGVFEQVGIGQWFRYFTGALEVAGALMLFTPRTVAWGAVLLATVSLGAAAAHLLRIGGSPVPALVLLTLSGLVLVLQVKSKPIASSP